MQEQEIYKLIDERYASLPESIKNALNDSDYLEAVIDDLTDKYNLWSKDTTKLYDEMISVIAGITDPKNFIRRIASELELDSQTATSVAQEINEKIFRLVREDIKNLATRTYPTTTSEPVRALHSTIDTSRMTGGEPITVLPKMKSLDADLLASVGARKPIPPPKPPLDKTLEAELNKKSSDAISSGNNQPPTEERAIGSDHFSFSQGFVGMQKNENDLMREEILQAIENPGALKGGLTAGIKKPLMPLRTMESDKNEVLSEKSDQPSSPEGQSKTYTTDPYREPTK